MIQVPRRASPSLAATRAPLQDRHSRTVRYVRLSVLDRCNFRCVYCMPADASGFCAGAELLRFDEMERLASLLARLGVRRLRLTGGEPLLRPGLPELVARLAALEGLEEVALTTNGFLLERHAEALAAAGLGSLNLSLDSLQEPRFAALSRTPGALARVLRGLDAAQRVGLRPIKLNAVVVPGRNDDELPALVRFAASRGLTMRFIESMPIGDGTSFGTQGCVTAAAMRQSLRRAFDALEPEAPPPLGEGAMGPARYYRAFGAGLPAGGQRVGIISAVTECFCADCNRLRITATGGVRACLADDGEVDLRPTLRSPLSQREADDVLEAQIRRALLAKGEQHAFQVAGGAVTSKMMHAIGG